MTATASPVDAAAFDRLMTVRHSCRALLPEPIPRATIEAILTTAQKTASWNNTQPWQVVIASGAAAERFRALMLGLASGGAEPTPDFAVQVGEECERLLALLADQGLRDVALKKLEGCNNLEIADSLGCSPGTVQRRLTRIQEKWSRELRS